jgi:hypothetical protein
MDRLLHRCIVEIAVAVPAQHTCDKPLSVVVIRVARSAGGTLGIPGDRGLDGQCDA